MAASGSRHSLYYVPETVYGVTPATPAFQKFRHNSSTLNLARASFGSEELRSDRMIADYRAGTRNAEGNVVGELSNGSHDAMLAAALCGEWDDDVLDAGAIRHSFTMERYFEDIDERLRYTGMQVDTLQFSMTTGAVVGMTFGFMGQDMDAPPTTPVAGATYADASSSPTMDAISGSVMEGGIEIAVATEVSLNLSNGMSPRFVIGSARTLEPSIGRSNLTGTLTAYFESTTLYSKFLSNANSSLSIECSDGVNTYTLLIPRLKYTGGDVPVSGEGSVSITMPFQGILDPVTGTNFRITRS